MLYVEVMSTPGLIFKAREVITPLYTSFANLTLGSTVQSFLSFDYKRNATLTNYKERINGKNNRLYYL